MRRIGWRWSSLTMVRAHVAVDVEVDQGVEAGVGGERLAQGLPLDGDGDRVGVEAVDDAGDLALGAEAAWTGRCPGRGRWRPSG